MATTTAPPSSQHIIASPKVQKLLEKLHSASEAQEKSISQLLFYLGRLARYYLFNETWSAGADQHMRDKFVSLEPNKCQFLYLLARSIGARNIVEAGTSFGVSTIYLALAVGQNVAGSQSNLVAGAEGMTTRGKVIATEKEPTKAARAREHWKEAGSEVEPWIELREGDLLETLRVPGSLPEEIDLLLLDIWTPMALPTLEIVRPKLKRGAVVIADNTAFAKPLYKEFLEYIHHPGNGFKTMTLPFSGGLEMSVYLP